jgi:hypothetical protein
MNGVEEIKAHPFFIGINWNKIRSNSSYLDRKNHHIFQKLKTHGIHKISIHMRSRKRGFLLKF